MFGKQKLTQLAVFSLGFAVISGAQAGLYVLGGVGGNGPTVEHRLEGTPENTPYGGLYFMGQIGAGYAFAKDDFLGRVDLGVEWQNIRTKDDFSIELVGEAPRRTEVETRLDYDYYFQFRPGMRLGKAYTVYGIVGTVLAPIENKNTTVNQHNDFQRQNEWGYRLGFGAGGSFEKDFMKGWAWSLEYTYTGFQEISQTLFDANHVEYKFEEKIALNQVVFAVSYSFW